MSLDRFWRAREIRRARQSLLGPPTKESPLSIARAIHASLLLGLGSLTAGCGTKAPDDGLAEDSSTAESQRGKRYCEVLLAFVEADAIEAQVWGTQGLNDCPEADWASVDPLSIAEEFGATVAVANGPRHWVLDHFSGERPPGSPRMFGTLEMQLLATLTLAPGTTSSVPYAERTVLRDSVFEFWAGSEIYELVAPDGSVYVMQSYAQIVDPSLSEGDLSGLGARLTLPADWQYRARTLDAPLVVDTPGEATVVQDELQNTYSRYVVGG
jgi:hypothetical protein